MRSRRRVRELETGIEVLRVPSEEVLRGARRLERPATTWPRPVRCRPRRSVESGAPDSSGRSTPTAAAPTGLVACTPNSPRAAVHVSRVLVTILMHDAEIAGIPGPRKVKRIKGNPTSDDLVQRKFERSSLDELWVTDITEHPTREGKVYCCCVFDTCSRSSSTRSTWPSSNAA